MGVGLGFVAGFLSLILRGAKHADAHSALGWSYYGLKKYADAANEFNRAIKLKSDYADAYYGLGRALQGQDKTEDARAAYQQAINNGSTNAKDALDKLK